MIDEKGNVLAKMDAAAEEAERDLQSLDQEAVKALAVWWLKWYMTSGTQTSGQTARKGRQVWS